MEYEQYQQLPDQRQGYPAHGYYQQGSRPAGRPNMGMGEPALDPVQARMEQRRAEQAGKERIQAFEIFCAGCVMFIQFLNLAAYSSEGSCGNFKLWLRVSLGLYLADMIVSLNQLMQVKKLRHENLWLLLAMYIVCVVNTAWFVYGNVIYWRNQDACSQQDQAPQLTYCMFFMVIIGYGTMCKCCCASTLLALLLPVLIRVYRDAEHGNWEAAAPSLLKKLRKGKFKPGDLAEDSSKECIICFVDYAEGDKVVTLPCATQHMFHEECITKWLKSNNTCPLCKEPVTNEALQAQRSNPDNEV